MKSEIANQARQHLLGLARKVLAGDYTQAEYESLFVSAYHTRELEFIRSDICKMIARSPQESPKPLSEENKIVLTGFISDLEKEIVQAR